MLAFLRDYGGLWYNQSPGPYTRSGLPDIIGVYRGAFIAWELKNPNAKGKNAKPRVEQEFHLRNIRKEGGFGFAASSLHEVQLGLTEVNTLLNGRKEPRSSS